MVDRRVLFFGDSVIAGVGDTEGRGWVGRIVEESFGAGVPISAYNLGVRRETSVEVVGRWLTEAEPRLIPGADCKLVFSFGANDTTFENGRTRVEPEQSLGSLNALLDQTAELGLSALIVGPSPLDDEAHTDRISLLSSRFDELCRERGVPFVAVVSKLRENSTWLREIRAGDGAHPAAGGYDALAKLVIDAGWVAWLKGD